ncbi:MAG: hypothetical protein B7Z81_13355 [Acidocella sp. 20-61-6]|nr:MAG: hypothetical protein B7Z81_13355 [Acidocella sp. 20-61-6]
MIDEAISSENWQARAEMAEAALSRVQAEAEVRLIQAELKAEAVRAGMIDLDGLKLLNVDDIRLSETGELVEAEKLFSKLKRTKPWLFSQSSSSSVAANPPLPEAPRALHANDLSHEEWISARAALVRRR